MNDDILQHHFDEVFSALQDRENFEIFTKMKPTRSPKVKRTFFKIVTPSQVNSNTSCDEIGIFEKTPRKFSSQNCRLSPYSSRPSSASATVVKAKATFRPFQRPASPKPPPRPISPRLVSPRPRNPGLVSSRPSSPTQFTKASAPRSVSSRTLPVKSLSSRPFSPESTASSSRYGSVRENASDLLGECRYCGRYFLGDYLTIHEEKCNQDSFEH